MEKHGITEDDLKEPSELELSEAQKTEPELIDDDKKKDK